MPFLAEALGKVVLDRSHPASSVELGKEVRHRVGKKDKEMVVAFDKILYNTSSSYDE